MPPCTIQGCSYVAKYPYLLAQHMRRHTGERPFSCHHPGCGHTLASRSALASHARTHVAAETSGRGIVCGEADCFFVAPSPGALARHAQLVGHGGLACPVPHCGLRFKSMASLSAHRTRHKREASGLLCKHCGAVYVRGDEYKRHVNAHRSERMREGRLARKQAQQGEPASEL